MMNYTAIIQNYGATRQKNWPAILAGLKHCPPQRLIVWNNDPDVDLFDLPLDFGYDVQWIHSSHNSLLGYMASVVLAETDLVFKQDNDLAMGEAAIERLLEVSSRIPAIVTPCAMNLGKDGTRPYTSGSALPKEGPCDVAIGRVWACQRKALVGGLKLMLEENIQPGNANDILFSLASQCYFLPVPYENLDEGGIGLCLDPTHYEQRNEMAKRLREGRCEQANG
jgi:hypothetical protein